MQSSLHVFFETFRFYNRIFANQKTKACLFCVHYHNEGLIAALKLKGIKAIEVQHGLIASNDFYYVYDNVFAPVVVRAFFPDFILLYGEYWKRILLKGCEWKPEQMIVAGDYLPRTKMKVFAGVEKQNILFIGAQKNIPYHYVNYTKRVHQLLVSKHPDWSIIVKIHPLEKEPHIYHQELDLAGVSVVGNETRLDDVLAIAKIQVSIYSTTFFDALGFNVVNFSLQNYSSAGDYAADMVAEGIALPLFEDEDPIEKFLALKKTDFNPIPREDVYASFNRQSLTAILE
jgi:hypothetical protein